MFVMKDTKENSKELNLIKMRNINKTKIKANEGKLKEDFEIVSSFNEHILRRFFLLFYQQTIFAYDNLPCIVK